MNDVIELPDSTSLGAIGQPLRRKEDERLLTGRGRFSDDFTVPGQTYAAVVRSPHPHARIVEIDTRRALAMPGVLGILTGQDCAADGLSPIPHNPMPQTRYDMKLTGPGGGPIFIGPQMLLPSDRVRHVGEAVAVVVAETARFRTPPRRSRSTIGNCRGSRRSRTRLPWVPPRCGTRFPTTSWSTLFLTMRRRQSAPSLSPITSSRWNSMSVG